MFFCGGASFLSRRAGRFLRVARIRHARHPPMPAGGLPGCRAGDGAAAQQRKLCAGRAGQLIQYSGGKDDGGQHRAFGRRQHALAQHGKTDGNAGLRRESEAQIFDDGRVGAA